MRLGVDVGGTHTDAVVLDDQNLVAATKTLTTTDIASGVLDAVKEVLAQAGCAPREIRMMTLGTTQFTNAVVERRRLARVAALRIGAQSSAALPIGAKWPEDLSAVAIGNRAMINGGHEYNGEEIVSLDEKALGAEIEQILNAYKTGEVEAVALTGLFSTANNEHERRARSMLRGRAPALPVACSHELGRIGVYQRENATLLNAALLELADQVIKAFDDAFKALSFSCPLFISQNDGTLMAASFAKHFPVFTFSSGPTNSMRGAAFLSGQKNAMVVDIGGTTSDIGMLVEGFPRPSGSAVSIGGVLTNFRMPDVLAVALGGGSIVGADGGAVGPQSVGRALREKARVFGGNELTATDIAVAAGRADIGDGQGVSGLSEEVIANSLSLMKDRLAQNIDKMKTSAAAMPLIVVGGGGFLAPDDLPGVSEVIRPENGGVANAIGAAFAQIGGEAETVYSQSRRPREEALAEATAEAKRKAVEAGAASDTVEIAEVDEQPMSYMDEPGAVLRVKAIGDVDLSRQGGVR